MKPVIIIAIAVVLLIPINAYSQLNDTPKLLEPQPQIIEVIKNSGLSIDKIVMDVMIN